MPHGDGIHFSTVQIINQLRRGVACIPSRRACRRQDKGSRLILDWMVWVRARRSNLNALAITKNLRGLYRLIKPLNYESMCPQRLGRTQFKLWVLVSLSDRQLAVIAVCMGMILVFTRIKMSKSSRKIEFFHCFCLLRRHISGLTFEVAILVSLNFKDKKAIKP